MGTFTKDFTPTGLISKVRTKVVAGGAAGNITVTGISVQDKLLSVQHLAAPTTSGVAGIEHTVTAGEDTAGTVAIDTGLGASLVSYYVLVLTAGGVNHPLTDAAISEAAGVITIADGAATFVLTATDVILITAVAAAAVTVSGAPADLTSEFTITAANTINNTGGTASTSGLLLVTYYDEDWGDVAGVP